MEGRGRRGQAEKKEQKKGVYCPSPLLWGSNCWGHQKCLFLQPVLSLALHLVIHGNSQKTAECVRVSDPWGFAVNLRMKATQPSLGELRTLLATCSPVCSDEWQPHDRCVGEAGRSRRYIFSAGKLHKLKVYSILRSGPIHIHLALNLRGYINSI